MKFTVLLLFSIASFSSYAEAKKHCFNTLARHIKEAIVHNREVAPLYNQLSDGQSYWLSLALISLEKFSLPFVSNLDNQARFYQEQGIPLLCEELAEMKDVPPFRERLPLAERPIEFYEYNPNTINEKIKNLMKANELEKTYQAIAKDLLKLENYPNQLCLTRHFLESIARTLLLAKKHREAAEALGLSNPLAIIKHFVTIQRRGLEFVHYLDRKAFPLQREGLPLYCQDIPVIIWKHTTGDHI